MELERDEETIRAAMAMLGRSRSERKLQALDQNRRSMTPQAQASRSQAQKVRRERERQERPAKPPEEKRPRGRPRKKAVSEVENS